MYHMYIYNTTGSIFLGILTHTSVYLCVHVCMCICTAIYVKAHTKICVFILSLFTKVEA